MADNTITKEAFVNIIGAILAFDELRDQFSKDMGKYLDGNFVTDFGGPIVDAIIDNLERCFIHGEPENDPMIGGIISWWLWDAPKTGNNKESAIIGSNRVDGMCYKLDTSELLYEYLTTGQTHQLSGYIMKTNTIPASFGH